MKTAQYKFIAEQGWNFINGNDSINDGNLVLVFGSTANIKNADNLNELKSKFTNAIFIGSSTSGEISDVNVFDDTDIATTILFERTKIEYKSIEIADASNSYEAGSKLIEMLDKQDLTHVFVLSDGLRAYLIEGVGVQVV
jgi:hypothetical protein